MRQAEGSTHRADMKSDVLCVCLLILLRRVCLFHLLYLQLRGKQGCEVGDGERSGSNHWELEERHDSVEQPEKARFECCLVIMTLS